MKRYIVALDSWTGKWAASVAVKRYNGALGAMLDAETVSGGRRFYVALKHVEVPEAASEAESLKLARKRAREKNRLA